MSAPGVTRDQRPALSIVLPVFNEGDNIEAVLTRLLAAVRVSPIEVLVVYDFEEDTTLPVVRRLMPSMPVVRLHRNTYGRGALNALRSGLEAATGEYVLVTMADGSDDPADIDRMLASAHDGADVVAASRHIRGGRQLGGPVVKRVLSKLAGFSLHWVGGLPVRDPTSNYKLYSRRLLESVTIESSGGFELALELTVKAHLAGFSLAEVPTTWHDRTAGESQFRLAEWLPHYLHWYRLGLTGRVAAARPQTGPCPRPPPAADRRGLLVQLGPLKRVCPPVDDRPVISRSIPAGGGSLSTAGLARRLPPGFRERADPAIAAVALLGVAAVAGLAIARGDMLSMLLLGGLVVTATAIVMREHGEIALRTWILAGAVAFPLLRVPRDEPLLTFDRAWIASLVLVMLLGAGERPGVSRGAGRLLWWALGWLTVAFGLRAMTTTAGLFPALKDWIEAVVLPAVLCRVAWRVIDTPDRFRRLTGAMAVLGTGLGLSGIAEKLTGYSLAPLSGGVPRLDVQLGIVRVAGPYNVPELYALMLAICLAGTLYWMRSGPRRTLVPGLCACLAILTGLGLTLFRAAWLAAVVTIAVMLGAGARRSGRWLRIGAGGGVVVLLALLLFGRNEVVATRLGDTGNVYGRLGAYAQSIEMFTERPLFGVGVGRFYAEQQLREDIVVGGIRSVEQAHSSFMAVLVEQGIAGILPFLAVLGAGWLVARSLRRRAATRADLLMAGVVAAAGLSYLVMSATLTLHTLLPSNGLLAILLGAAARRLGQLEDPEESS